MIINTLSIHVLIFQKYLVKSQTSANNLQSLTDKYGDMLRDSVEKAPLPVTWIMEHFQSDIPGPQFGYSLQPWFYAAKVTLWLVNSMLLYHDKI